MCERKIPFITYPCAGMPFLAKWVVIVAYGGGTQWWHVSVVVIT
jgi:hypothetical protein